MTTTEQAEQLARKCVETLNSACLEQGGIDTNDEVEKIILSTIPLKELLEVARAAQTALNEDALWAFGNKPPVELEARWNDGTGSLTSGPNNCKAFFNAKVKFNNALSNLKSKGIEL